MEDIVPQSDPNNMCPTGDSDASCNLLFLGVGVTIFIVAVVLPAVCCCACTHTCCFRRDKKDGKTHFERTVRTKMQTIITDRTIRGDAKINP